MTKLRKHELRAELNDRLVKFENKDTEADLIELLCLDALAIARIPPLNADVISHICTYFGDNLDNEDLWIAAQMSIAFRDGARIQRNQLKWNVEFKARVWAWFKDRAAAEEVFGPISGWAFSSVTNMSSLLYSASRKGNFEVAKLLLTVEGTNINLGTKAKSTSNLYAASWHGNVEMVKLLLGVKGIDVNKAMMDGKTSLHVASRQGHIEIVKLLLDVEGIDINKAWIDGRTSLHVASYNGHVEVVKLLLDAERIDVNQATVDGWTSLHVASQNGHTEIVKLLLDMDGIDINKATNAGCTPSDLASENDHNKVCYLIDRALVRFVGPPPDQDQDQEDNCVFR